MDLAATLDDLGFDRQGLVDAAMLCGTDFNEGVRGIGPKTAVKAVREHGDLWGVLDARGVGSRTPRRSASCSWTRQRRTWTWTRR